MSDQFLKPLKKGATIGIVSPSSTGDRAPIEKGIGFLESRGYRVVVHPQNYLQNGQLAGSDEDKVAAFKDMFADKSIDAILCARGGNGAIRLLDKLDYTLIKNNPKPFIGYSDITVLLHAISKNCGFPTYHGPMLASFGRDFDPRTADEFFALLESENGTAKVIAPDVAVVQSGEAEGTLIGGNMTLMQGLIGTPYDWTAQDSILFIEDVDEVLYRVDRMLQHFRLAGKLHNVRGVIVGDMVNVPDGETLNLRAGERPYGRDTLQILQDNLPSNIPVCMNFPCGHAPYITTLPVRGHAKLTVGKSGAELVVMPPQPA